MELVALLETMNVLILLFVCLFLGKLGTVVDGLFHDPTLLSIGAISALLKAGSSLLFQRALQLSPVSLSVPYLAFTPALLLVTSYFMLGEQPDLNGVVGVIIMTAGAYGLNTAGGKDRIDKDKTSEGLSKETRKKLELSSSGSFSRLRASEDPQSIGIGIQSNNGVRAGSVSGGLNSRASSTNDLSNVVVSSVSDTDGGRFELQSKQKGHKSKRDGFRDKFEKFSESFTWLLPDEPGSRLMLLVAILWSFTSDLDKMGKSASGGDLVVFVAVQRFCMLVVLSAAAVTRLRLQSQSVSKLFKKFTQNIPLLFGLAALEMYTMTAYLKALDHLFVSYAIAAKRSGILLSVLAGALFFNENIKNRLPYVLIILAGMTLVLVSGSDF